MLELPDVLYSALQKAAEADGMTPADWIAVRLAANEVLRAEEETSPPGQTLADLFTGRTGRIRSGGKKCFSEDSGQKFTDDLEAKKRAGHL
jgi:hypothetical protein